MREMKRIVNKRFFVVAIALLMVNAILVLSFNLKNKAESDAYRELLQFTFENKKEEGTYEDAVGLAWKQYIKDNEIDRYTLTDDMKSARDLLLEKAAYIDEYDSMVAEKMAFTKAVLATDFYAEQSFERINLYKTYMDWEEIKDTDVSLSNGRWLETLYEYDYSHLFVVFILIFCVYGFFAERKSGLYYIIHTAKCGRAKLFVKRALILFGGAVMMSSLFYLESAYILLKIYGGFEGIHMPAVSDEMFILTSGTLSRFQFVFVQILASAITAFALSLFLWFILTLFNNVNIGMFACLVICGLSVLLQMLIPSKTWLRAIKFFNIYYLLYPNKGIDYYNWGYDFGLTELWESTLVLTVILGVGAFIWNLYINVKRYFTGKSNAFERAIHHVMTWIMRVIEGLPTMLKETYKVLISQKVVVVLAILIYIVSQIDVGIGVIYTYEMGMISEYYDMAEGMYYSEELESVYAHFENEYNEFLKTIDETDPLDQNVKNNRQQVLIKIRADVDRVKALNEQGINATVLKPYEHNAAFGLEQSDNQKMLALVNILAAIVISAGYIAYEKECQIKQMALAYRDRRKWLLKKMAVNVILIGIFELVTYGIYYYKLLKVCELTGWTLPLKSLPMFRNFIINPSIIGFVTIDLLVRFVLLVAISGIICFASKYIKLLYSVLAGLIIAVPQFLCMLGFEAMDKFSIGKYLAFLPVFNEIDGNVKLCYIVFSVIIVLAVCLYGNIIKNCTRE